MDLFWIGHHAIAIDEINLLTHQSSSYGPLWRSRDRCCDIEFVRL
ncbi:MAG: hypothetical protein AAF704_16200 [Cyanobacteria bacterium P01_D01_bin.123]